MGEEHTSVSRQTEDEERAEANAPHQADREPTPEEEAAADEAAAHAAPDVAAHEREMNELGARVKGEGRI